MIYREGDKLRIVKSVGEMSDNDRECFSSSHMTKYLGKMVEVKFTDSADGAILNDGADRWWWRPTMIEGFAELPKDILSRMHSFDKVKLKGYPVAYTVITGCADGKLKEGRGRNFNPSLEDIEGITLSDGTCVYKYHEPETAMKLTVAEISKRLGYDVEVVRG